MALDQSFVGRTYPPTAGYEVGREKIREFAEAVGDPNPVYVDPEAARALGHPDVIAPPTFAFAITFKAAGLVIEDPELGLDYSRVVHGDQKFAYTRPLRAGDVLTVVSTIEAVKSMAGNDILDVRGEVHDASGDHVVTAWTKLVSRAAEPPAPAEAPEQTETPAAPASEPASASEPAAASAPAGPPAAESEGA